MKRKSTVVRHLHKELTRIAKKLEYCEPVIHDNQIHWDGPFQWATCMTGGCSVIAQELGRWSKPLKFERGLHKVIDAAEKNGFVVECETYYAIGVYGD